ncbi:hypothetical protein OG948_38315 (plasmid) [Embleya sp. NBC_00888]|uniref:hypothetical protein n=1 Tax=Embleya sp. NBC_00888 TaxID=2975960 RepID=UPI002F911074|nr:hypothetical protein OG948_38315 [Embleya sp. NBC_00888]
MPDSPTAHTAIRANNLVWWCLYYDELLDDEAYQLTHLADADAFAGSTSVGRRMPGSAGPPGPSTPEAARACARVTNAWPWRPCCSARRLPPPEAFASVAADSARHADARANLHAMRIK